MKKKRKKKGQIFRVVLGRTECGPLLVTSDMFFVAICLLPFPTCTAALSIYFNSLNSRSLVELLILSPLSWVLVLEKKENVWKSVVCRGNKIVFLCLLRCMIFLSGRHPRRVSPQPCSWFNFLCVFVVAALCFSFELNSRAYFAARGFLVGLQGTCNAGVFFRSCW